MNDVDFSEKANKFIKAIWTKIIQPRKEKYNCDVTKIIISSDDFFLIRSINLVHIEHNIVKFAKNQAAILFGIPVFVDLNMLPGHVEIEDSYPETLDYLFDLSIDY